MRQEDNRQPMGSESLGTLVSSWRDGTFSEIWADWKWIWGYTKRYRRAVWFYTILGVASSTLGLVSAVASKYSIDIITGYDSDHLWFIVTVMVASALVGLAAAQRHLPHFHENLPPGEQRYPGPGVRPPAGGRLAVPERVWPAATCSAACPPTWAPYPPAPSAGCRT